MQVEPSGVFTLGASRYGRPCAAAVRRALDIPCGCIYPSPVDAKRYLGGACLDGLHARRGGRRGVARAARDVRGVSAWAVGAKAVLVLVACGRRVVGVVGHVPRDVGDIDPRAVIGTPVDVHASPGVRAVHARVVDVPRDLVRGVGNAGKLRVPGRMRLRVPALGNPSVLRRPSVAARAAVVVVVRLAVDVDLHGAVPTASPAPDVHGEGHGVARGPVAVVVEQHVARPVGGAVDDHVVVRAVLRGVLVFERGGDCDARDGVVDRAHAVNGDIAAIPAVVPRDLYLPCIGSHWLPSRPCGPLGCGDQNVNRLHNPLICVYTSSIDRDVVGRAGGTCPGNGNRRSDRDARADKRARGG